MQAAVTWSWDTLVREIHRVLVPGGTVQFAEFIYDHISRAPSDLRRRQFPRSAVKRMETKFTQVPVPIHPPLRITNSVLAGYTSRLDRIQKVYNHRDS